jgi:hypothetical protein
MASTPPLGPRPPYGLPSSSQVGSEGPGISSAHSGSGTNGYETLSRLSTSPTNEPLSDTKFEGKKVCIIPSWLLGETQHMNIAGKVLINRALVELRSNESENCNYGSHDRTGDCEFKDKSNGVDHMVYQHDKDGNLCFLSVRKAQPANGSAAKVLVQIGTAASANSSNASSRPSSPHALQTQWMAGQTSPKGGPSPIGRSPIDPARSGHMDDTDALASKLESVSVSSKEGSHAGSAASTPGGNVSIGADSPLFVGPFPDSPGGTVAPESSAGIPTQGLKRSSNTVPQTEAAGSSQAIKRPRVEDPAPVAAGMAAAAPRRPGNMHIETLRTSINALTEARNKEVAMELLIEAEQNPTLQGSVPGTTTICQPITNTITFLKRVEAQRVKEGDETSQAWLRKILDPILLTLPQEQQTAPDANTSRECAWALVAALGISYPGLSSVKPTIKKLIGVNLAFHNAHSVHDAAPAEDNPIPQTGKFQTWHDRYAKLMLPNNRDPARAAILGENQAVFATFFAARMGIRNAADTQNGTIAASVSAAMRLLERLRDHPDSEGHPAPRAVEPWLNKLFAKALNTRVEGLPNLRELDGEQRTLIVAALKQDHDVRSIVGVSKSPVNLYPLILHITGASLWRE